MIYGMDKNAKYTHQTEHFIVSHRREKPNKIYHQNCYKFKIHSLFFNLKSERNWFNLYWNALIKLVIFFTLFNFYAYLVIGLKHYIDLSIFFNHYLLLNQLI